MKRDEQVSEQMHASNLAATKQYLAGWKASLDRLGIWVREPTAGLYDSIAFSLLNKAYRLSGACICLIETGFIDEAYGLSRSILECALNLRYLSLDVDKINARANNFAEFFHFERKHFLELCRKQIKNKDDLAKIEAKAKLEGIDARISDPKMARINDWKKIEGQWDGFKIVNEVHPLDAELNPHCRVLLQYVTLYRAASAMVHCSISALDNTFAVSSFQFKVGEGMKTEYDHRCEPLTIVLAGLYLSARYALYGAKLDSPKQLSALFKETVKKVKYDRQS
jgi:hypothetical protein